MCFNVSSASWLVTGPYWEESGSLIFILYHIFTHIDEIHPEPSFLQAEQVSALSAFPHMEDAPVP